MKWHDSLIHDDFFFKITKRTQSKFTMISDSDLNLGVGPCPDGTGAVSACLNGLCGYGYQCYNNLCCPAQFANSLLSFAPSSKIYCINKLKCACWNIVLMFPGKIMAKKYLISHFTAYLRERKRTREDGALTSWRWWVVTGKRLV